MNTGTSWESTILCYINACPCASDVQKVHSCFTSNSPKLYKQCNTNRERSNSNYMDESHEQWAKEVTHKRILYDYTHNKFKSKQNQTTVFRYVYCQAKSLQILKTNFFFNVIFGGEGGNRKADFRKDCRLPPGC